MSKKRKMVQTQFPDIFKIMIFDSNSEKWLEPTRGKKFTARRYDKKSDGSQERVRKGFGTLAEAKAFRAGGITEEKKEELSNSPQVSLLAVPGEEMTFKQLVEKWTQVWLPSKNLSTQLKYRDYLRHFDFFNGMPVAKIDPDRIDQWISLIKSPKYLEGAHSTRCNYKHEMGCLRSILNYYSTRVNRNYRLPFLRDHRLMIKVKDTPVIKKDLTVDQFTSFITQLKMICQKEKFEPIYYMALIQYGLYARIQSVAALYVEDFDLSNNRLEMKRKVQWLRKKGVPDRVVSGTKTDGGKVYSPIPQLAVDVFKEWRLRSGVRSGLLFQVDGKPIAYRSIQNKYNTALKAAGLPFTATHLIRHASLVEAYNVCRDILAVQNLANHKDLQATQKYAKVRDSAVEKTQIMVDQRVSLVWRK